MTVFFNIAGSTIAGTPDVALRIAIPSVFGAVPTISAPVDTPCLIQNNGTWSSGFASVTTGGTYISIYISGAKTANWTASAANASVSGSIRFVINGSS
jgi:hypothetical protein